MKAEGAGEIRSLGRLRSGGDGRDPAQALLRAPQAGQKQPGENILALKLNWFHPIISAQQLDSPKAPRPASVFLQGSELLRPGKYRRLRAPAVCQFVPTPFGQTGPPVGSVGRIQGWSERPPGTTQHRAGRRGAGGADGLGRRFSPGIECVQCCRSAAARVLGVSMVTNGNGLSCPAAGRPWLPNHAFPRGLAGGTAARGAAALGGMQHS